MVSYSKAPNHVKQDLKSESKTHNIWKGYVYLESSVIKLLAIFVTAMARMFHIWHFYYMIFKYEKGKLYFTHNFDQTLHMALDAFCSPVPFVNFH